MEECRTEASIGVEYSESIHGSSEDENTNSVSIKTPAQAEGCSPSQRRKRKRISPHSTPKVADGKVQDATAKNKSMQTLLHMYISVLTKATFAFDATREIVLLQFDICLYEFMYMVMYASDQCPSKLSNRAKV